METSTTSAASAEVHAATAESARPIDRATGASSPEETEEGHAISETPASNPAKSKLCSGIKPIPTGSLATGAVDNETNATKSYFFWTVILTGVLVPISIVMFINTRISNDLETLLKKNDAAAVILHRQLVDYQSALEGGTPNGAERANQKRGGTNLGASQALLAPDLVENLAEFARVSRQIYAESRVLNFFILWSAQKPEWPGNCIPGTTRDAQGKPLSDIACEQVNRRANLELDVRAGDPIGGHPSIPDQGFEKLAVYQDIRTFAQQTEQMNTVFYGAITAYLLPVFYSLLGACAFGLRNTIPQAGNKTYQPSYFDKTRLIIALIAGTVVGLFNNFTQGVSASPLAIAFLVGYAVEVFFSFLDALVRTFEGVRNSGAVSTTGRV